MMIELMLVEGVSDVMLISYYLQNVYGWKHEKSNILGIDPLDEHEHIESLSKDENQLVLCGVGGNGKFAHFVEQHHVNDMIVERDISSLMVVTDRDEDSNAKIGRIINSSLERISIKAGEWIDNCITDSFGQPKNVKVIIDALNDIPEQTDLIQEVVQFVESLKEELVPELNKINKANKATVGTFFSIRYPQSAMRFFGIYISKIDWSKSESLKKLFLPFIYLGEEKP
ncbi:MAG: DUF3226 domain-containing protein [Bariatricus sp.]